MLSQTILHTNVAEHAVPMMNVLTDIHSGMKSLNLKYLTVWAESISSRDWNNIFWNTDGKINTFAMTKICDKKPYSKKCVLNGYDNLDTDKTSEWFYILILMFKNWARTTIFGPFIIAASFLMAWITLLIPKSYLRINDFNTNVENYDDKISKWYEFVLLISECSLPTIFFTS